MLRARLTALVPYAWRAAVRRCQGRALAVPAVRRLWFAPADALDRLAGRRDPLTPPRRLMYAIGAPPHDPDSFHAAGRRFLRHAVDLTGLKPHHRVLDVGCGVGRMALALCDYLAPPGGYEGFDIMADCVTWCRHAITPRYPHFRFTHVRLYSRLYNRVAREPAAGFRFPYADGAFDRAVVTSVFTHLLPADLDHYLGELSRTLRPGGRCLATAFLLNDESWGLIAAGRGAFRFLDRGGYAVTNPAVPEEAVAVPEGWVRDACGRHGLEVAAVRHGTWCGRPAGLEGQDVLVLRRGGEEDREWALPGGRGSRRAEPAPARKVPAR